MKLKNLKDRLKDETLDLSLCDLEEVPVKEIAAVRKATNLDLSSNLLVSLPSTFVTLKQIVKLDLSRNMLTEIPENFGELKQLRHLDLYANQISRLPLSLGELKNLRWLDLKENPLTPAVATVAGPCSNLSECRACATNIVDYLSKLKVLIEEEKQKRLIAMEANADAATTKKSEKKKKKKAEKENKKNLEKNGSHATSKITRIDETETKAPSSASNDKLASKGNTTKGKPRKGLWRSIISTTMWSAFLCTVLISALAILPSYYEPQSQVFFDYVETRTGVPLKEFHRNITVAVNVCTQTIIVWSKNALDTINETYEKHFKTNVDVPSSL